MHKATNLLLIAVTAAALAGCSEGKKTASAAFHNVFTVNPISVNSTTEAVFPALVEEARTIAVGFKTAGQIERIAVKEGQRVERGQILAELDTVDYSLGISTLREKYRQMVVENQRRARLHASGNMSDNDYENAVSGLRQLSLQLRMEENKLSYCTLKAPVAGVVTKVNFEASEMVDAGTPVFELMDNSRLEVVVDLPVRRFADRERFERFSGESPLEPGRNIELTMVSLTPRADNSQLYRLRLTPQTPVAGLTPGMNMTVRIGCSADGNGRVSIPLSALFDRDGAPCVWVVNPTDSVIAARRVEVFGTPSGSSVDVSGITPADAIVRAGVHHLTDGEKVNILTESETNPGSQI